MEKFSDAPTFPGSQLGAHLIKVEKRKAFVEWITLPRNQREPQTIAQWARENDISPGTVSKWRHDTRVYAEAADRLGRHVDIEVMPDALNALATTARDPKNRQHVAAARVLIDYLKWHVARTGEDVPDVAKLSDEELRDLMIDALDELDVRTPLPQT